MNQQKTIFSILICTLIFIPYFDGTFVEANEEVYTTPFTEFNLSENTSFRLSTASPLTWYTAEGTRFFYRLNVTSLATNDSISIVLFAVAYNLPGKTVPEYQPALVINKTLTEIDEGFVANQTLVTPEDVTEFTITVKILAKNSTMTEQQEFFAEFPGNDEKISIRKTIILPIIQLPGFPDLATFLRWIIIFVLIGLVLSFPAIFAGTNATIDGIKTMKENRKQKKIKEEKAKTMQSEPIGEDQS